MKITWRCCCPGLTGSCLGLFLSAGLDLSAASLGLTPLFQTGLPPLHFSRGAQLAPSLCSLAQDHCGFLGTSGVGGTSAPPCCCLLAANMLHTLQPEPPRSKLTCTTDYSEQLWCCNCALSAVAAPVSWKYIAKWITVKYKIILCTLSNIPS